MVIDLNGTLLTALELVYEQSRPEVRGLWRARIDPYLRIHTNTRPDLGDWVRPWLEVAVDPVGYLDRGLPQHGRRRGEDPVGLLHDRPVHRLAAMDQAGVDAIVLHPESFGGPVAAIPDVDLASGLLGGYNRYVGSYCRADPRRLTGSIQLHGLQTEWSLLEIARLAGRGWVAGAAVQLRPDLPISDPRVAPVLAGLEEAGLPLFHRAEMYDSPRFPGHADLWSDPILASTLGPAWDAQRFLTAVICHDVLERHPDLRVCTLDGGVGWIPSWLERLAVVSPSSGDAAQQLLRSGQIVATIAPHESPTTVQAVVDAVGDRCLAWGSAFPRSADQGPAQVRQWRDVSASRRERFLQSNALRLLGDAARSSIQQHKETA